VVPNSLIFKRMRIISQVLPGSRLPVGSSAMMREGRLTIALAIATRCFSPPESSLGKLLRRSRRPTISRTWGTVSLISFLFFPASSMAKAIFSEAVFFGRRWNSWKMMPI